MLNARIDIKIAKKKVWETTASGLPQINGILSYQDMTQIPTTLIPAQFIDPDAEEGTYFPMKFGTQHSVSMELVVSQLVFNGTYIVALQSTKIYMKLSEQTFKHILLPIYISAYTYKEKRYTFFVNGQSGKLSGKRPYSFWKIFFFIVTIISVLALLFLVLNK